MCELDRLRRRYRELIDVKERGELGSEGAAEISRLLWEMHRLEKRLTTGLPS